MQTIAASVILDDLYRMMEWDDSQLEDRQKASARMAVSLALQEIWEAWWWQELMTLTQQNLRDTYASGTTYAAGDEVYFPATEKYYQCLAAVTGMAPEELDESGTGSYELNSAFWVECKLTVTADDHSAEDDYELGGQVRNPEDGLIYVERGGLTVTAAGTAAVNGDYGRVADINGRPAYASTGATLSWSTSHPAGWKFFLVSGGKTPYRTQDDVATPDLVEDWNAVVGPGALPLPTVTAGGTFAETPFWANITAFTPSLETNRKVRMVSRLKPTQTANPGAYDFIETADGIELTEIPDATPWVWARRVTPVLTGDDFDAAATYEATSADELVFDA